jgi:hypothetical protein
MRVAVGAPVGDDRAEILPRWLAGLHAQSVRPEVLCGVYSQGASAVRSALLDQSLFTVRARATHLPFHPRAQRNDDPRDPWRARHMANLRNELRGLFLATDCDVFLSLDTDILLEEPTVVERLCATLSEGWDVACALTYLSPKGAESGCYNAGYLPTDEPRAMSRVWERATQYQATREPPVKIDVPMAAYAIRRHAMAMCRYYPHDCGEDIGFADCLKRHNLRVGWRTDVEVRHVWNVAKHAVPVGATGGDG